VPTGITDRQKNQYKTSKTAFSNMQTFSTPTQERYHRFNDPFMSMNKGNAKGYTQM
jgi:hypothetical protein